MTNTRSNRCTRLKKSNKKQGLNFGVYLENMAIAISGTPTDPMAKVRKIFEINEEEPSLGMSYGWFKRSSEVDAAANALGAAREQIKGS